GAAPRVVRSRSESVQRLPDCEISQSRDIPRHDKGRLAAGRNVHKWPKSLGRLMIHHLCGLSRGLVPALLFTVATHLGDFALTRANPIRASVGARWQNNKDG